MINKIMPILNFVILFLRCSTKDEKEKSSNRMNLKRVRFYSEALLINGNDLTKLLLDRDGKTVR